MALAGVVVVASDWRFKNLGTQIASDAARRGMSYRGFLLDLPLTSSIPDLTGSV